MYICTYASNCVYDIVHIPRIIEAAFCFIFSCQQPVFTLDTTNGNPSVISDTTNI